MRAYAISILFNKLFVFGCIFLTWLDVLLHNHLKQLKLLKKTIISIYKIEVFE